MKPRHLLLYLERLDFGETFLTTIWKSAVTEAHRKGIDLTVIVGHYVASPRPAEFVQNTLYCQADPGIFDGCVVCGTIFNLLSPDKIQQAASELPPLPRVSTTIDLTGTSSVLVDNTAGLREAIRHLIQVHGKKRIACIRGPANNAEADVRQQVWQEELAVAGLATDLLVQGHFNPNFAPRMTEELLEKTGGRFDAVVACNDEAALFVQQRLEQKGYRIGPDIAILGFDNISKGRFSLPSLTTISQPIESLMETALGLLLDRLEQGPNPQTTQVRLPTTLQLRESCGCPPSPVPDLQPENFMEQERRTQNQFYRLEQLNQFAGTLGQIADFNALRESLRFWLDRVLIRRYCVSVCVDGDNRFAPLIVAPPEPGHFLPLPPLRYRLLACNPLPEGMVEDTTCFPAAQIAPKAWFDLVSPAVTLALSLSVGERLYGVLVMEVNETETLTFRSIQTYLASVLDREYRLGEMMELTIHEQSRIRAEQEKMQALSVMVRGLAHELNAPLGIGITSASFMGQSVQNIRQQMEGQSLSKSSMAGFLESIETSSHLFMSAMTRASILVNTFKKSAVSELESQISEFDLVTTLELLVASKLLNLSGTEIRIDTRLIATCPVRTHHDAFIEVIPILLDNCRDHAYPEGQGLVTVALAPSESRDGWYVVSIEDQGKGIEASALEHIFEPFYAAMHKPGHVGLGLSIAWNIVRNLLHGSIHCESAPGSGTRFTITFPAILPESGA